LFAITDRHQTKYCTQQEIPLSPQSVIIHERKSRKLETVGRQTADHQTATFELEQRGWHLNRLNDHRQCTQPLARCRLRVWWWNLQISSHCATTRARLCLPQTCSNPHRHARTTAVTTTFSQCYACFAVGCCAKHSGLRNSRMCGSVQPTHNTSDSLLKKVKLAHTRLPSVVFRSWSLFLAVSLQVMNHKPGGRLPLLSARHAVTPVTLKRTATNFYRAMLCIRGTSHGPVSVRVRLSVTSRSSTKTAKWRITQTTPHDTPKTLVFWCQRSSQNSIGVTPYEGAECRWGGSKNGDFWLIARYISKTVQDRRMVSIKVE